MLALDVGSSSVRARAYDAAGRALAAVPTARVECVWTATPEGGMETAADGLLQAVAEVLDTAVARLRAAGVEVSAVSTATFWHSLLGVGADGRPLTPVYGWGDMRAADAALRLRERVDESAMHARTGCFLHPSYPAVKLLWLRGAAGDTFSRAAAWMSFAEYLELRFFGVRRCSLSMASGTGLLDLRRRAWDAEMLEMVGVAEEALSPLVDADAPALPLRAEWARRWPELDGIPWLPPLGDGACANLGSGASGEAPVGVTVGTSAAVRALWRGEPVRIPRGLWCYRLDAERLVMGRALSNAGNGVAWLRESWRLPPEAEAEAEIAAMQPHAHGLLVLPLLLGERAPGWEEWRGASILGLTRATRPVEVLRAWLEGVSYHLAGALDALEGALGPVSQVVASGGAMHASPTWRRILADVLGRRVVLSREREETSRGAALMALERLGVLPAGAAEAPPTEDPSEPDPVRHERYRAARARQAEAEALLARLGPADAAEGGGP